MDPLSSAQYSQAEMSSTSELGKEESAQGTVQQNVPVNVPANSENENTKNASIGIEGNNESYNLGAVRPAGIAVESHGMEELLSRFGSDEPNAAIGPSTIWPELLSRLPTAENDNGRLNLCDLGVALGSRMSGSTCGEVVERICIVLGLPLAHDSFRGVHQALEATCQLPIYISSPKNEPELRANASLFLACIGQYGLLHEEMVRLVAAYPEGLSNEEVLEEMAKVLPNKPRRKLKKIVSKSVTDENGRMSADGFCELVLREKVKRSYTCAAHDPMSEHDIEMAVDSKVDSPKVPSSVAEQNGSASPTSEATWSVSPTGEKKIGDALDSISVAKGEEQDGQMDLDSDSFAADTANTAGHDQSEGAVVEKPMADEIATLQNDPRAGANPQAKQVVHDPPLSCDGIIGQPSQALPPLPNQSAETVPIMAKENTSDATESVAGARPVQPSKPSANGKSGQSASFAAAQKQNLPTSAKKGSTTGQYSANASKVKTAQAKAGVPRYAQPTLASARPAEPSAQANGVVGQSRALAANQRAGPGRVAKANGGDGPGRLLTSTVPGAAKTRRNKPVEIDWLRLDQWLCYQKNGEASARRAKLWSALDSSQRPYLSMASMETPLRDILALPATFELKPALASAVHAAKAAVPVKGQHGPGSVERAEFRLVLLYLHQYMDYVRVWSHVGPQAARKLSMADIQSAQLVLEKWLGPWEGFGNELTSLAANHGDGIPWGEFISWALARPPLVAVE